MSTLDFVRPKIIGMKSHPELNEQWLETRLKENPALLGLGEVDVRDNQRRQPSGGRLDEVEIQLGSVDESHIIRTIEYWDIERKRYPQYEHVAVIVAEDVTSRFLNVISLFNGAIPLIAIQIKAVEVNGALTLIASKVVDLVRLATDEEDEGEVVDRTSWQNKSSDGSMKTMDRLIALVETVQPGLEPKYNKHYVGLTAAGMARNFVIFRPKKNFVLAEFKISQDEELASWLAETRLNVLSYDSRFGYYRVRVKQVDLDQQEEPLRKLITKARDSDRRL